MIGVARCSSSSPTPTPVRMSGRARTTTYVSAAVTRTASVAKTTTDSPGAARSAVGGSAGGRRGDLDIFAVVAEVEGERGVVLSGEERAGQLGPAQLTALRGDGEGGRHRLAGVLAGQHLLDQLAGQLGGHLADHLPAHPALVPQLRRFRLGEELADPGVRVEQLPGVAEAELRRVDLLVARGERQLGVEGAVDRDHLEVDRRPGDQRLEGALE